MISRTILCLSLVVAGSSLAAEPPRDNTAAATRTLDAITIEGAVDVPQVLFITSRDNARFDDGLGWEFLPEVAEILAGLALPTVIRPAALVKDPEIEDRTVTTEPAAPAVKE